MAAKGGKASKPEARAGARNLAKWLKENPPHLRHGAYSKHIRRRYSDKRTREGKQLALIMRNLRDDLGPDISEGQNILLNRIAEKLRVLMSIGQFIDLRLSLINRKGELLPCLGRNYLAFSESVRRDLEAAYLMSKGKKRLDYQKVMGVLEGGKM